MKKLIIALLLIVLLIQESFGQQSTRGTNILVADNVFNSKTIKAIIIGVSDYKNIEPLNFADDDAVLFYNFLIDRNEVKPENISLFLNGEAEKEKIMTAFHEKMYNSTKDDLIIIFFAGHGDKHTVFNRTYLLLSDVSNNGDYNRSSAIEVRDIQDYAALAVNNGSLVFLAIDACHSGKFFDEREPDLKSSIVKDINDQWKNNLSITACGPDQLSEEDTKWGGGHGVFTYYLVNGLKGASDENGDNMLAFYELVEFVKKKVREDTKFQQVPQYSQESGITLLLSIDEKQKQEAIAALSNKSNELYADAVAHRKQKRGTTNSVAVSAKVKNILNQYEELIDNEKLLNPIEGDYVSSAGDQEFEVGEMTTERPSVSNLYTIKYSPDGESIAIGGENEKVYILNSKTYKKEKEFDHTGVRSVDYSPDGRYLASASWFNNIKIWEIRSEKLKHTLTEPTDDTRSVCFSPTGKYLAAGGDDKRLRVWETSTWTLVKVMPKKYKGTIYSVCFGDNDNTLISGDESGEITVWDIEKERIANTFQSNSEIKAIKFAGDCVIFSQNGNIRFWNPNENRVIKEFDAKIKNVVSIETDLSGQYVFIAGDNRQVNAISTSGTTQNRILDLFNSHNSTTALAINPTNSNILGVTYNGFLASSSIQLPQKSYGDYAYDFYKNLLNEKAFEGEKEKLSAMLGAGLLMYINKTITPFINGDPVLPDASQMDEAKRCADIAIDLFKGNDILTNEILTSKLILEVYEVIVNNDFTKLNEAVRKIELIKKSDAQSGYTYNIETVLYQRLNELFKAKESASVAIERVPSWTEPKSNLGKTYFFDHKYQLAIDEFNKIVKQRPDLSIGYLNLGDVYSFLYAFIQAESNYKMALALDSLNPLIYCQYAEMLINDDKLRQAESFLDQSLKIGDNFSLSYFQMGEVYFKKMLTSRNVNHFDSAYSYYSAAIEIDPNNPRYHVSLSKLLFNAYNTPALRKKINGRFDRKDIRSTISKNCNLAIKLNPNYFEAYFWKAMNKYLQENKTLYFFDNTKSEALDVLKRLISKYPEIPEPYFYVAQLYQAFNDDGHSIKYYNFAIEQDSMHAPSYKALYHIYKKNNRSIDLKKLLIEINDRFTESEAIIKGNAWVLQVEK